MHFHVRIIKFHQWKAEQSRIGEEDAIATSSWSLAHTLFETAQYDATCQLNYHDNTLPAFRIPFLCIFIQELSNSIKKKPGNSKSREEDINLIFRLALVTNRDRNGTDDGKRTIRYAPHQHVCVRGSML